MAKNNNLKDFVTDIADTLRTLTQTTEPINPQDFTTKMHDIKENLDVELNEQDTLLAELQSSVDELPSKPYDTLQKVIDGTKSCMYLLYEYTGNDVDFLKDLDTSEVTNMSYMFGNCNKITKIPQLDTHNVKNMSNMFLGCYELKEIPQLDTSKVNNMYQMFNGCNSLIVIPKLDTRRVTNFTNTFMSCSYLETIEGIDMIKVTSSSYVSQMFAQSPALKNVTIKNIKVSLALATSSKLLTDASIINAIQELWDNTDNALGGIRQLTLSSTSLARTNEIYVKLIDITDEMRAKDEYIDNKRPCVVCESTDEGAMTLKEYGTSKNWIIA